MSRRSERRWFIYERHRGWSLNPLTSRIILSSIDLSSHPVVFFRFVNFFPLPHAFPCSLSSNCCQFSREGRSYWLMITQDNNDHSRGDLYRLAWVFRATILLLPSCLERQRRIVLVLALQGTQRIPALIFEPDPDKSLTLFVKIMESTGRW